MSADIQLGDRIVAQREHRVPSVCGRRTRWLLIDRHEPFDVLRIPSDDTPGIYVNGYFKPLHEFPNDLFLVRPRPLPMKSDDGAKAIAALKAIREITGSTQSRAYTALSQIDQIAREGLL